MRPLRRLLALLLVASVWLAQATPAFALLGWSASGSQTAVKAGQAVVVTYTVSNDNLLSLLGIDDIGCVHVNVGASFAIQSVTVIATPGGRQWNTAQSGSLAVVHSDSGGGRLDVGQSVTFSITAVAFAAGSFGWTTRVIRDQSCGGGYISGSETLTVQVAPAPTPTPSPSPTPRPTPTPKPTPTPLLPLPSLPLPSLPLPSPPPASFGPSPSAPPSESAAPSREPGAASSWPSPSPSPSSGDDRAGATPSSTPAPGAAGATPPPPATGDGRASEGGVVVVELGGDSQATGPSRPLSIPDPTGAGPFSAAIHGFDVIADATWALPAATIAGPGLLVLLWLALQAIGAAAWLPAVRRLRRGEDRPIG